MRYRLLLSLCLVSPIIQAFTLRNQGYFDVSLGSSFIEDVLINSVTTEYYPGPSIQVSTGMAYKNGLGLGMLYSFNYNKVKGQDIADSISTEFQNAGIILNFTYKMIPYTSVSFFFNGGPGLLINTDQNLKSTATTETASTVTTADASGSTTSTETTTTTDQSATSYESIDNFSFGYQVGGGIEYREDNHKSFIFQFNLIKTNILSSTFNTTGTKRVQSSATDTLNNYSGSATMRYYF